MGCSPSCPVVESAGSALIEKKSNVEKPALGLFGESNVVVQRSHVGMISDSGVFPKQISTHVSSYPVPNQQGEEVLPNSVVVYEEKVASVKLNRVRTLSSNVKDAEGEDINEDEDRVINPKSLEILLRASYVHRGGKSCLRHHADFLALQKQQMKGGWDQLIKQHLPAIGQMLNLTLRRLAHFAWDLIEIQEPIVIRSLKLPKDKELTLGELQILLDCLTLSKGLEFELRNPQSLIQDQPHSLRYFWNRAPFLINKVRAPLQNAEVRVSSVILEDNARNNFHVGSPNIVSFGGPIPSVAVVSHETAVALIDSSSVTIEDLLAVRMRTIGMKSSVFKWKKEASRAGEESEEENLVSMKLTEMGLARYSRVREPDLVTPTTSHVLFCIDLASFLYNLSDTPPPLPDAVLSMELPTNLESIKIKTQKHSFDDGKMFSDLPAVRGVGTFSSNHISDDRQPKSIVGLTGKAAEVLHAFQRVMQSPSYRSIRCGIVFSNCDIFCQLIRSKLRSPFADLVHEVEVWDRSERDVLKSARSAHFKGKDALYLRKGPQISIKHTAPSIEDDSRHIWHYCGYDSATPENPLDALRFIASIFAQVHDYSAENPKGRHRYPLTVYAADLCNETSVKKLLNQVAAVPTPFEILENPKNVKWWPNIGNYPNVHTGLSKLHLSKIENINLNSRAALFELCPMGLSISEVIRNKDVSYFELYPKEFRRMVKLLLDLLVKHPVTKRPFFPKCQISHLTLDTIGILLGFLSPYSM